MKEYKNQQVQKSPSIFRRILIIAALAVAALWFLGGGSLFSTGGHGNINLSGCQNNGSGTLVCNAAENVEPVHRVRICMSCENWLQYDSHYIGE